ncbi:Crp/Fnr family transcriptional regulator [Kiloniella laminariae]|uniref:Crp/Fnr family transcriptional regulator n=1 Tax=Kiloniella laminariae TaxID=454162 RepID=A0ABT4LSL3_9PROT|nr:Crp/Fnr family transcriptional regulator [Kiloniella laminariae]MCZ4282927.1 Crp/Fnr family transcriptional regulator [Kiloniella laminariae]
MTVARQNKDSWGLLAIETLRASMEEYCSLSDQTWNEFSRILSPRVLKRHAVWFLAGEIPSSFGFVFSGLLRFYVTDTKGNEYNKVFFPEGTYPGSMVSLLEQKPSDFSIQALEETRLITVNFHKYRELLQQYEDLKWFHILYLEKNWVLAKESREVALVQENATQRYLSFRERYPELEARLSQYHIASHIGITPTQLSRIRTALS